MTIEKTVAGRSLIRAMPEYDDCRAAAETHGAPLTEVMAAAKQAALTSAAE